jgi:hypothetical protein
MSVSLYACVSVKENPLQVGPTISGLSICLCYNLSSCSFGGSDQALPRRPRLLRRASGGLVPVPAAGYDYGGNWANSTGSLSPAGMAASVTARRIHG